MQVIKKYWVVAVMAVLVILGAFFIYKKLHPPKLPSYLVEAVGFVDGDLVHLNTKYPGRVKNIFFKAGDEVKKGDIVAVVSDREYLKQKEALTNQIAAKEAEYNLTLKTVKNSIKQAEINIKVYNEKLAAAESKIKALKAVVAQDERDYKRIKTLYFENKTPRLKYEMAALKLTTDKDKLTAALKAKNQLLLALKNAQIELQNAKNAMLKAKALKDAVKALQAKKAEIDVILSELKLRSPVNGIVESRIALPGEVLPAGGVVVDIINPSSYYLKVYVNTLTNDKIKIGQKAEIFLDSNLSGPIPARVVYIASKAEFTPKEVAVRDDRITRVYEVWLRPLKPAPVLKLGLPAIGVILLDNSKELPKTLKNLPKI